LIHLLSTARVRIVIFTSHTMQIFQVLDLTSFGVLKKRGQYQLPCGDDAAARFIREVCRDFRLTMIDVNLWGISGYWDRIFFCRRGWTGFVQRENSGWELALQGALDDWLRAGGCVDSTPKFQV
jgi:hypothetical protein